MPKIVSMVSVRPAPTSPSKTKDLPFAHIKGYILHHTARVQMLHFHDHIPDGAFRLREHIRDLTAYHQLDHLILGQVGRTVRGDVLAVPVYRDVVADPENLVHLVGDIDKWLRLFSSGPQ